jgi:Ca-activated chloride channel family protein
MPLPPLRLAAMAGVTAVAVAVTSVTAQQQFRAGVNLVHLPVVVTARDGKLVSTLSVTDFEVLEDGKQQRIEYFAQGAEGNPLPVHLGLLLDSSESMEQDLKTAAGAAVRFVDQFDEAVDVTFVDFDSGVRLGRFEPASYPQLFARIRAGKARGGTSLYDALGTYLESTLERSGQHVVLMHTDGGDSTSSMTYGRLQELLRLANVIVYAVGYLDHQLSNVRIPQQMKVNQITKETGGEAYFPSSPAEMDRVFDKIRAELAARYTLGYASTNTKTDGRYRKVEVRLTRPELKGTKVRTRSGYLAPHSNPGR